MFFIFHEAISRLFSSTFSNLHYVEINPERERICPSFYSNSFSNIATQLPWDSRGSPKRIEVFRKVGNLVRNRKKFTTVEKIEKLMRVTIFSFMKVLKYYCPNFLVEYVFFRGKRLPGMAL